MVAPLNGANQPYTLFLPSTPEGYRTALSVVTPHQVVTCALGVPSPLNAVPAGAAASTSQPVLGLTSWRLRHGRPPGKRAVPVPASGRQGTVVLEPLRDAIPQPSSEPSAPQSVSVRLSLYRGCDTSHKARAILSTAAIIGVQLDKGNCHSIPNAFGLGIPQEAVSVSTRRKIYRLKGGTVVGSRDSAPYGGGSLFLASLDVAQREGTKSL